MRILELLGGHWFELLQTASIVVGFLTAVHSIREDTKERRIENLFTLTQGYRDIWWKLFERAELVRILDDKPDLNRQPATPEEELFVHTLILHLRSAFKARALGMQFDDDALTSDIRQFFTRPIPSSVWAKSKQFQDADFVTFVNDCISPCEHGERVA